MIEAKASEEEAKIDDSEMFLAFELLNKFLEDPKELTTEEKAKLRLMGVKLK